VAKQFQVCRCGNRLGEVFPGGLQWQRHKGRVGFGVIVNRCEDCDNWIAPPQTLAFLKRLGFDVDLAAMDALPEAA
jgi:hypothetical protein